MTDISDVKVEEFKAEAAKGIFVLPESEMRKVVIPSPPTVKSIPTNPRDCVIVLGATVTDEMKAYAKDNKIVFACLEDGEAEDLATAYMYAKINSAKINIKKDAFSVKATADKMELAAKLVDVIMDMDDDAALEDAEEYLL